jgi:putative alpha-1,2-mannosidase
VANRRRTPGALLVPAADPAITGFILTHVDGTGCAAAGDVPILPVTGALGNGTSAALTTTTHAGIGQFTFPATTSASLLLKLDDPATPYAASTLNTVGDDELTGSVTSTGPGRLRLLRQRTVDLHHQRHR